MNKCLWIWVRKRGVREQISKEKDEKDCTISEVSGGRNGKYGESVMKF